MKSLFFAVFVLGSLVCFSNAVRAGVTFLPATSVGVGSNGESYRESYRQEVSDAQKCRQEGYTITFCNKGKVLTNPCPYDSSLYASCACSEEYRFSAADCLQHGFKASPDSCNGLHKCY